MQFRFKLRTLLIAITAVCIACENLSIRSAEEPVFELFLHGKHAGTIDGYRYGWPFVSARQASSRSMSTMHRFYLIGFILNAAVWTVAFIAAILLLIRLKAFLGTRRII